MDLLVKIRRSHDFAEVVGKGLDSVEAVLLPLEYLHVHAVGSEVVQKGRVHHHLIPTQFPQTLTLRLPRTQLSLPETVIHALNQSQNKVGIFTGRTLAVFFELIHAVHFAAVLLDVDQHRLILRRELFFQLEHLGIAFLGTVKES